MSPVMAARTLIVGFLVLGTSAHAGGPDPGDLGGAASSEATESPAASRNDVQIRPSRRAVAVIDLTNDPGIREVANKLLELLALHNELAPPAISDGAALVDKLAPDDDQRLADAQKKRLSAEQNLAQRQFREAAIDAVEGQELLLRVTPRAAIGLYADLALALGQSRLGEKKDAESREAFALTHRLDPRRTLDDLHYLPEVVAAFEAAKQPASGSGVIVVRGTGRAWIDGEDVGVAPGEFKVAPGRHVVWLTGVLRETAGREVVVTANRSVDAAITEGQLTRPQIVVRYRIVLSQAQDPAARASAMLQLARFVNVHDAVLLSSVNGKIIYQTWRDREPGFSALSDLGHDSPTEILRQLAPVAPPVVPAPPIVHPAIVATRWYRQPTVQIGMAAAIVAAIIGGYLWVHYNEPPRSWDSNITGFGTGSEHRP